MIVDHSDRLHQRVADGRADEFESASQQIPTHRAGFSSARGHLRHRAPTILDWLPADKAPQISVETPEFFSYGEKYFRVLDCGHDLQAVAYDSPVAQQPFNIAPIVAGDVLRAISGERLSIVLPFFQNDRPAQPGLRAFKNEELEKHSIIMHGDAPFLIVIADIRFGCSPRTTRHIQTAFNRRKRRQQRSDSEVKITN